MSLRLMLCGIPKSGTTTIHYALQKAGLDSRHHKREKGGPYLASLLWRAWSEEADPLRELPGVEAVTEAVRTHYGHGSCWPMLNMAFLRAVRRHHQDALLVLQTRRIPDLIGSIDRWKDLRARITATDLPGLPAGKGGEDRELAAWIQAHYDRVRMTFTGDPRFVELAIEDPHAPWELSHALGVRLPWWGVKRANKPETREVSA